ncbi:MAG: hypothetical protein BroJett021_51440 [Chloroflexota bacterium]|nr:hypothetical protein [Caldilinea sp.]GIK76156.1 MAG: hypothetical protein BroJett021_51440 [Chloroflexota bacterium]
MSYRVTDKSGKTVGYVRDQSTELAGMLIGGVALIALSIILIPVIAVGYGLMWGWQAFFIFWLWATNLPLTPFPNLNGVLVIIGIGITGAGLVRYVRIHLVLLLSITHILSLLLGTFLVVCWLAVILIPIGVVITLPLLVIAWLFSTDAPLAVLNLPIELFNANPWLLLFAPLLYPVGWLCAKVIGIYDKKGMLVTTDQLSPSVGKSFLLIAILTYLAGGILFLTHALPLAPFAPVIGAAMWGAGKGFYFFTIQRKPFLKERLRS